MDIGQSLISFGLDLRLLQGFIQKIYETSPSLQLIDQPLFRLELDAPTVETQNTEENGFRFGLHLTGLIAIGSGSQQLFDVWVRLRPAVQSGSDGLPVGVIEFDRVERALPAIVAGFVEQEFASTGRVGSVLAGIELPVFEPLLTRLVEIQYPGVGQITSEILDDLTWDFYLGYPGFSTRNNYTPYPVGKNTFEKRFENTEVMMTVPALVATVALKGANPVLPGRVSNVIWGSGMQLVVSKTLLDQQLAREAAKQVGTELNEGVKVDAVSLKSGDGGIDINLKASKTGVSVKVTGSIMGEFYGGTGGSLLMIPAVDVDVDTSWWVDVLGALAVIALPVIGIAIADILIWDPLSDARDEAPTTAAEALSKQFNDAMGDLTSEVMKALQVPDLESRAYIKDVWFSNGNFTLAAAAFAGTNFESITALTYDVAHVGHIKNHLKPVTSVKEITLSQGHVLKPWQAGELAKLGIVQIPHHHGVENHQARGGYYLRSNPNHELGDNLVPNVLA